MKRLFLVINTLLILLVVGFTGLITLGILTDKDPQLGGLLIIVLFTVVILLLLFMWRKSLNRVNPISSGDKTIMNQTSSINTKPKDEQSNYGSDQNEDDVDTDKKVIVKGYYKNSWFLKEGEFVKPIPSTSNKNEMDQFLLEKMEHESLKGNYSKSELEYINKHLRDSNQYDQNLNKSRRENIKITVIGTLIILVVLFGVWKVVQMIPSWIYFLIGTYVIWFIVRPFAIGFLVKITGDNVMVRGKSLMECFQLRQMGNSMLNNIIIDGVVIPGILFSVLYISFSSGTNEFGGRLSDKDVTGTYIFNMSDSERRQMIIASSGVLQFEDQELVLSRNRSYTLTSWSRNNGEMTSKVKGSWILESLSDTIWKNGKVSKVRFSNYIKLDDGKVLHISEDGNLHPYKTIYSSIVWKRD